MNNVSKKSVYFSNLFVKMCDSHRSGGSANKGLVLSIGISWLKLDCFFLQILYFRSHFSVLSFFSVLLFLFPTIYRTMWFSLWFADRNTIKISRFSAAGSDFIIPGTCCSVGYYGFHWLYFFSLSHLSGEKQTCRSSWTIFSSDTLLFRILCGSCGAG